MDALEGDIGKFWDKSDIFQIQFKRAKDIGFADEDAHLLEGVGLPRWAAPNLHLHAPEFHDAAFLNIGEDRNGCLLFYEKSSGKILTRSDDGRDVVVASNLRSLWSLLIAYARMVDEAIQQTGPRSFVDNKIPNELIDNFERFVRREIPNGHSAWDGEVDRLRTHASDS